MDVLTDFLPQLVSSLPMKDVYFTALLAQRRILTGDTKSKIKAMEKAPDRADYYLDTEIVPSLSNGDTGLFEKMLSAMEEYGSDHESLKDLASAIRQRLEGGSNERVEVSGTGITGTGAGGGGGSAGFDSNATLQNGVVTFNEKQSIEDANRRGMKWFLDNVILAELEKGKTARYKGLLEVMEAHDDIVLRRVAKDLDQNEMGMGSIKVAYSLAIKHGQALCRDLQVLLVGAENTGKTCLVSSFLGEKFVEGQPATDGIDVDVCKIYYRNWRRITENERVSHLNYQIIEQFKSIHLKPFLPSKCDNSELPKVTFPKGPLPSTTTSGPSSPNTVAANIPILDSPDLHKNCSDLTNYNSKSINGILWDFSGQVIAHNTHSVFISEEGVPVITFNASMNLTDAVTPREGYSIPHECPTIMSSIHYYLQVLDSVCSVMGGKDDMSPLLPTAVLAGTHIDRLHPDIKVARKIAEEKHLSFLEEQLIGKPYTQHLAGCNKNLKTAVKEYCFFVSNKCRDEEFERLKCVTAEAATSLKKMQPLFFLKIEQALLTSKKQIISKSHLVEIIAESAFPIAEDSEEFEGIVKYLHGKRTILHLSEASNVVILSPQWLAKLFSYVITAHFYSSLASDLDDDWKRLKEYGILHQSLLRHMLEKFRSDYPSEVGITYQQVVDILSSFHLLVRITREAWFKEEDCPSLPEGGDVFMVPSLFKQDDKKNPPDTEKEKVIYYRFPAHFIPISCSNQLIARCICRNVRKGHKLLWMRQGKVGLQLGSHQKYYISRCEEKHSIQLTITVVGGDVTSVQERRELIDDVTELLDDIMKVLLPAAKRPTPFVPCPLCPNIHIALREVISGDTIYCPHRNDEVAPYHHYDYLIHTKRVLGNYDYRQAHTTYAYSSGVKEFEILLKNYSNLVRVLTDNSLYPSFVSYKIITVYEYEEILQSGRSSGARMLLRFIINPVRTGYVKGFYDMLTIMEKHGSSNYLARAIRKDLMHSKAQTMSPIATNAGTLDCATARKNITKQYKELAALPILSLLLSLVVKDVITMDDKKNIENKQKTELTGMTTYFLDSIIIKSLDLNISTKFKGFLVSMEEHEDPIFHEMAKRLGGSQIVP